MARMVYGEQRVWIDGREVSGVQAVRLQYQSLLDSYRAALVKMRPVLVEMFRVLAFSLRPMSREIVKRWVIERRGITEVDVRRIDFEAGVVVLWNRRRVPIDWADLREWSGL